MIKLTDKIKKHSLYKRFIKQGYSSEQILNAWDRLFPKKEETKRDISKSLGLEPQWTIVFNYLED